MGNDFTADPQHNRFSSGQRIQRNSDRDVLRAFRCILNTNCQTIEKMAEQQNNDAPKQEFDGGPQTYF